MGWRKPDCPTHQQGAHSRLTDSPANTCVLHQHSKHISHRSGLVRAGRFLAKPQAKQADIQSIRPGFFVGTAMHFTHGTWNPHPCRAARQPSDERCCFLPAQAPPCAPRRHRLGAALGSGAERRTLACFTCCCPPCASRSARRWTWTPALGQILAGGSVDVSPSTPVLWLAGLLSASVGGWLAFLERQGCGSFLPCALQLPLCMERADGAPFSDSRPWHRTHQAQP